MNLVVTPEIKRNAYERDEARHRRKGSSDGSADGAGNVDEDKEVLEDRPKPASMSDYGAQRADSRRANHSSITLSSGSMTSTRLGTGSSESGGHSSDFRSPLPRSFPYNYPYISAISASSVHPRHTTFHGGHRHDRNRQEASKDRQAFLSALSAPSIIANPSEMSREEESWIAEIIEQVQSEKGAASTTSFRR